MRRLASRGFGATGQALYFSAGSGAAQVLTAAVYVLAARWSTSSTYGYAVALVTGALLLAGVVDFGCNSYLVREIASGRMRADRVSHRQSLKLVLTVVLGAVCAVLIPRNGILFLAVVFTSSLNQTLQTPLRGLARVHNVAFALVGERCALFVIFIAGSRFWSAAPSLVLATAASSIVGSIALLALTPNGWRMRPSLAWCHPWKGAWHFGFYSVSTTVQGFDLPLLAFRAGPDAAGVFGAVNRWISPMALIANAFSAAAFPVLAAARNSHQAWDSLRNARRLLALSAGLCLVIAIFAPGLTSLLLGTRYEESGSVLRLLALGTLLSLPNQLSVALLLARGREATASLAMFLVVVSQLVAVWFWSPNYGAVVAAWAFLGSQVMLGVLTFPVASMQLRRARTEFAAPSFGVPPGED